MAIACFKLLAVANMEIVRETLIAATVGWNRQFPESEFTGNSFQPKNQLK
jgi:hypothetical protein